MKTGFPLARLMAVTAALLVAAAAAWWFFKPGDATEEKASEPTAQVRVAPLRRGRIERTLTAYGTAAAAPDGTRTVSYPFESRVVAVQANLGQTVAAGDALLRIEPSADARLALDTARSAQQSADQALRDAQGRFRAHLATNADLAAAGSAARDARLRFDSLQSRAPEAGGVVKAPAAGVVTKLPTGPGMVVVPDGPLAEIAVANRFEARLGIAPADAGEIHPGQPVHLTGVGPGDGEPAGNPSVLRGTVRLVGASVDPATRMVDAFVALDDPGAPVLIGTYLRAEIVVEEKEALLAPRAAVLPTGEEGHRATIFTLQDKQTVRHEVETGIDDGRFVEITAGGALAEEANVVIQGNYELEDKMPVEIDPGSADAPDPKEADSP